MTRNPHGLPTKTCPVCLRDFTWRKQWERVWDEIRYCSDRCRRRKSPPIVPPVSGTQGEITRGCQDAEDSRREDGRRSTGSKNRMDERAG